MARTLRFPKHLTSYLTLPFRRTPTHLRRDRAAVVQTSPSAESFHSLPTTNRLTLSTLLSLSRIPGTLAVLRLPYEAFEEIFSYLPVLPWAEVYHRHLNEYTRPPLASEIFWERAKTLLALSATCRTIRQMVLMEAWKNYVVRLNPGFKRWAGVAPVSQCEILLGNSHLASYVRSVLHLCIPETLTAALTVQRTLMVESVSGTYQAAESFVECLSALPNLHTLDIAFAPQNQVVKHFADALKKRESQFQQVRALILPDAVHWLLRCCPNVEDLTCCGTPPGIDFVESLAAGGSNCITKLTVLCQGGSSIWWNLDIWPSRIRFISLSPRRTHETSHRGG